MAASFSANLQKFSSGLAVQYRAGHIEYCTDWAAPAADGRVCILGVALRTGLQQRLAGGADDVTLRALQQKII